MFQPSALLSALVLAAVTIPPSPVPHADAIRTLAEAHAVVLVASKRCDNLSAGEGIDGLQAALGLSNADSATAYSQLLSLARDMNANADQVGSTAWCATIVEQFGPEGSKIKGLLKRCDPHANSC